MKKIIATTIGLCLIAPTSQASTPTEPTVSQESREEQIVEEVQGSIRLNGASYEWADNYAPGEFKYTPIGGDPSLLARALELNRQIDEDLSKGDLLLGLYGPLLMKISRDPAGALTLLSFSRAPGYHAPK
jgi:hypothetical protein